MADRALRFGVIGLSRGFDLTRATLAADPRVRLVAAADPRPEARAAFEAEFGGRTYAGAEAIWNFFHFSWKMSPFQRNGPKVVFQPSS